MPITENGMCSCNRSRGYDEMKRRYEQLEQITRAMYREIQNCEIYDGGWHKTNEYRVQLEELGVSLDTPRSSSIKNEK